jgi:hypothetical protein
MDPSNHTQYRRTHLGMLPDLMSTLSRSGIAAPEGAHGNPAERDDGTRLRFSRISIARCADLVRSFVFAWVLWHMSHRPDPRVPLGRNAWPDAGTQQQWSAYDG